ncbi:MAG: hypothetical protein BWX73_02647 [Lentisphaerae bacterium ADurb.Bin082]|nr:MAG: hypothetical protein BWX73_02647 [Lentisphaerae bacterium ADurb.Bin082]
MKDLGAIDLLGPLPLRSELFQTVHTRAFTPLSTKVY